MVTIHLQVKAKANLRLQSRGKDAKEVKSKLVKSCFRTRSSGQGSNLGGGQGS